MRRRFTNQNINQSGYTDNTNTAYNNYNVIPSNNITMQNTSTPILGQGLDQYGNPITQPVVMQPGQDYQFGNASYVEETPMYQGGGYYNDPRAYQMWNQLNNPQISNNQLDWATTNQMVQPNPNAGAYNVPTSYPPAPSLGNNYNQQNNYSVPQQTTINPNQIMSGDWLKTGQFQTSNTTNSYNLSEPTEEERANMINSTAEDNNNNSTSGRFQFYNPYGGYNVENASFQLGQGIESGNTLQTVGAGLKMVTGLGRNVLSGLGFQRQNEKVMDEYKRQQRNTLTQKNRPQYMQEGGEVSQEQQLVEGVVQALQQGMQPEEVLQALIQQGLDEQTATQLIQSVMQQLQGQQPSPEQQPMMKNGGQYLEKLKNKRIKNYTFNEKTGNYEVEFE